jgi:hypothetical protein
MRDREILYCRCQNRDNKDENKPTKNMLKKKKKWWNKPKRKNDCRSFFIPHDAVLVKDRRRAKNLLHRLNVTEYQ